MSYEGLGIKPLAVTYSCMAKPHYHRRMRVSLLSSGWDQVVPRRYGRQGRGGSSADAPAPHSSEVSGQKTLTRRFRETNLTWINRKRVTSVEVNSNVRDVAKERSVLGLYGQASRLISTRKLNALLHFHTAPINHLVLMVP